LKAKLPAIVDKYKPELKGGTQTIVAGPPAIKETFISLLTSLKSKNRMAMPEPFSSWR
jgi:hypothetical protein